MFYQTCSTDMKGFYPSRADDQLRLTVSIRAANLKRNISFSFQHPNRPKKTVTFLKSKGDDAKSDSVAEDAQDGSNKADGETAAAAPDAATAPEKRSWLSRLTSKGAETESAASEAKAGDKNRPKSRACSIL